MSTIRLTAFALFEKTGPRSINVLHGGIEGRVNDETGKIQIVANSVPFNSEVFSKGRSPHDGLLMLYGIRDMLDATKMWRAQARELGCEFVHAEFEFEVGTIFQNMVSEELLRDKARADEGRFINIKRTTSSFQMRMLEHFSTIAHREGVSIDEEMSRVWQISTRPNYWDEIFKVDADVLGGVEILIIPVADDPVDMAKIRQLAYVRKSAKLVGVYQGRDDVELVLPFPWGA